MKDGAIVNKGTLQETINSMPEKVWTCFVSEEKLSTITKQYKVSNIKSAANGAELRIISQNKPFEDAICVEPTLEDVFLYYFGEKVGDDGAAL